MYYSYNHILSYKAFLTMVIKERGYGGTLGMKGIGVRSFLKDKKQFVWLRLNDVDCAAVCADKGQKFFKDIPLVVKNFLPEGAIIEEGKEKKITGPHEITGGTIRINGESAGYVMSLHLFDQFKGTEYSGVKWIFLDEFIPADSKRLTYDVAEAFANMVETVARTRPDVRIIACANSIKKSNQLLYKLGFRNIKNFGVYKSGKKADGSALAVLHYVETKEGYKQHHADSNAGRLAKLMGYQDVILENKFKDDASLYLDPTKKLPFCSLEFICHTENDSFRIYAAHDYYICRVDENKEAYMSARVTFDKKLINQYVKLGSAELKKSLAAMVQTKHIRFENEYIRDIFYSVL